MPRRTILLFLCSILLLMSVAATTKLSNQTMIDGLKEALQISSQNTIQQTGKEDGYFKNEAIKILMPEKLQTGEKLLRKVGLGSEVDDFILSMNRAAEKAAPQAASIFIGAIKQMTIEDAVNILKGNDTAATEYFRGKCYTNLSTAFQPIVSQATNETGVTRRYKALQKHMQKWPVVKNVSVDIDQYVVEKALNGLFYVMGEEEKKIRKDPAARVTKLLKDVFGQK